MNMLTKQNLLLMIRALYFCVEEQWAELGRKHDITPAQQHILFLLYSTDKKTLSPSELSDLGCWHISTVTRLLKPLETRGLIQISSDKRPRYKKVELTQPGTTLLQVLIKSAEQMDSFPLKTSHLNNHEMNQFLHYAQTILEANRSKSFGNWLKTVNAQSY